MLHYLGKLDLPHIIQLKHQLTVGREQCDLNLLHPHHPRIISRHHATFELHAQQWYIQDEKSLNGCFVNGKKG